MKLLRWMREGVPARMFWVGLLVRVLYLTLAHTYKIRTTLDHFNYGWEMGRIGRALATGYGYADAFTGHSGPTAWTPPLYPVFLGGVFKVFGVYTKTSAWVILTVNSVFSAATAPAIFEMSRRCFARDKKVDAHKIALWSGWLWALYPAAMQYAVHWIWDMAFTACFFAWILVLALRVRGVGEVDPNTAHHQTLRRWVCFGLLWGLVGLTNSSLMSFLPACGLWMISPLLQRREKLAVAARNAVVAAVCCLALMIPWAVRNQQVFHTFIPLRSNLGAELYESVLPTNAGFPWGGIFPMVGDDPKFVRYRAMGEVAFVKAEGVKGKAIWRQYPLRSFGYVLKRLYFYWFGVAHPVEKGVWSPIGEALRELNYGFLSVAALFGLALALRERIPGAWLFFWGFALIPLVYYAITVQARFRSPLEPMMTVLIVYLFQSAQRPKRLT